MAETSHIEWTDATWNPVTGCSVVSPGCTNCYAMRLAGTRLQHHWSRIHLTQPTKAGPVWTGEVRFNEEWLTQPLQWRRPRKIFVCAHGDLFHESVPDEWIDRVFAVMALAPQHIFQVLTKRSARMRRYFASEHLYKPPVGPIAELYTAYPDLARWFPFNAERSLSVGMAGWPLPNVWLGVSVEDQTRADERIPDLLCAPAVKYWLSCEPLLGPLHIGSIKRPDDGWHDLTGGAAAISWVIVGGESGPGARPMHPD